eukprot:2884192-Pleurochrysis_carterae.AAC.1
MELLFAPSRRPRAALNHGEALTAQERQQWLQTHGDERVLGNLARVCQHQASEHSNELAAARP